MLQSFEKIDVPVVKILMADNLKLIIDDYIMNSKPNEQIPEKMFELFDLANHVSDPKTYKKLSVIDLKRIVKMDKVNDIFRDLPISDQKLCHFSKSNPFQDSESKKMYFQNKYRIMATNIALSRIQCILSLNLAKGVFFS